MNRFRLLLLIFLIANCSTLPAQNPFIGGQFTADPTARVFDGKVYVYPSHDIRSPIERLEKWFCMADYHVFSSENLTDWTDHGVIVSQNDVPWVAPDSYSMWAPDCVARNGKYYFYFPSTPRDTIAGKGFAIGVAIGDRPYGPFTPMAEPVKGVKGIDPCVFVDKDGQAYMYWCGGSKMFAARLKDNMTELASDPVQIGNLPKGFMEGPFVFERGGMYYFTFPWVQDKTETLAYAMGQSPMGPFEFKGLIMDQWPSGCWTNHHSVVEYKQQWYLFYHHNDYSPEFDKNRSARIDSLFFNPDGTIQKVKPTLRGVGLTSATGKIQLDRYSEISKGTRIDFLNKDHKFEGWKTIFSGQHSWIRYNAVDFGQQKPTHVKVRVMAEAGGILQIRMQSTEGPVVSEVRIPVTKQFMVIDAPVTGNPQGVQDLFICSGSQQPIEVDWILFDTLPSFLHAEDGSRLWLRFNDTDQASLQGQILSKHKSPTVDLAMKELSNHWKGQPIELRLDGKLKHIKDGYVIKGDREKIVILAAVDAGLLYGAYHLLRLQQTGADVAQLDLEEIPAYDIRILNHWDNLNGSIERGYAGRSLWKWEELPGVRSPRYEEYARANASIGINATVLNNVNASPNMLNNEYLNKVKVLADIFRPYGIRVYLSANFSSPKVLGGLSDSDPMNKAVRAWWKDKVKEIYRLIPDFGGLLVKANSEGQPGPQDYGRTHADGANMLADALKPYGGIVMWRAFVYSPSTDDRAKQACLEFMPLDGQFRDNVIIQIKNGPIDFQPREPFNPLFGALKQTSEMIEFQITQEYLGFSNHLVYLAPLFKETLDSDTHAAWKPGSATSARATVARITDGSLRPSRVTAISGVANTGDDTNWCGHHFAQANWYAFGRLAWNHGLTSGQIADEWIRMTFTTDEAFVEPVKEMMLSSREACVNYMMPLGLHHIFSANHHYGPGPWEEQPGVRRDWTSPYYHNAGPDGLGFDRTKTGSYATSQYFAPLDGLYEDIATCPEDLILWFHHVPWTHRMKNERTLWDELCYRYDAGVKQVREYQKLWDRLEQYVDEQRFNEVQAKLRIHARDAVWWKDACLLYFQTYSKLPVPYDIERPVYSFEELRKVKPDLRYYK